jgi:CysZ protein
MLCAGLMALMDLGDRHFRRVFWRSVALTLALLLALGYGAHLAFAALPRFGWSWLNRAVEIAGDLGIVVGSLFLIAPAASIVISFFLEEIAAAVEAKRYPADPPGRSLGLWPALTTALAFLLALIFVNLIVLPLYLIPGANLAAYLAANGYLLGREYFELVAFRHHPPAAAARLRRAQGLRVFLAGVIIALALLVPILNLLAPLFGTAFMVHVVKHAEQRTPLRA